MTKREKALWLHEHYKNYSLKWYLENDARLNAMFRKVYHRYMNDLNARASKVQLSHIEDLGKRMREVYEDVYGTNFDSDCRLDRAETNRKVQAIRSMWVVVARDNQERLLFKVTTTAAVAMQLQEKWLVV